MREPLAVLLAGQRERIETLVAELQARLGQSAWGAERLGRMLGVCETLRKRGQDAMGYLVEALAAHRAALTVPLIPAPP